MNVIVRVVPSTKERKRDGLVVVCVYEHIMQCLDERGEKKKREKFQHDLDQLLREVYYFLKVMAQVRHNLTGTEPHSFWAARRHLCKARKLLHRLERKGRTARERLLLACVNRINLRQQFDGLDKACREMIPIAFRKYALPRSCARPSRMRRHFAS